MMPEQAKDEPQTGGDISRGGIEDGDPTVRLIVSSLEDGLRGVP